MYPHNVVSIATFDEELASVRVDLNDLLEHSLKCW